MFFRPAIRALPVRGPVMASRMTPTSLERSRRPYPSYNGTNLDAFLQVAAHNRDIIANAFPSQAPHSIQRRNEALALDLRSARLALTDSAESSLSQVAETLADFNPPVEDQVIAGAGMFLLGAVLTAAMMMFAFHSLAWLKGDESDTVFKDLGTILFSTFAGGVLAAGGVDATRSRYRGELCKFLIRRSLELIDGEA